MNVENRDNLIKVKRTLNGVASLLLQLEIGDENGYLVDADALDILHEAVLNCHDLVAEVIEGI